MLGGCPRVMYYKLNGVQETTPPDTNAQLNFEVGNLWEAKVAEALDENGMLLYWWNEGQSDRMRVDETKWKAKIRQDKWVDKNLFCAGTPDIVYMQDNKVVLLDVKTMKADAAKYIAKQSDEEYFESHEGYYYQLGLYLIMMKRRFKAGLEEHDPAYAKLCIISKDNGAIIKEPCLFYTPKLEQDILARIKYMHKALGQDIPECTCEGWQVNYCNYGVVDSIRPNKSKKEVPHECCAIIN